MMMKCTALCLVALALLGFCDAQYPYRQKAENPPPPPPPQRTKTQEPQQQKQVFEKPLEWTFPIPEEEPPKPAIPFELRHPVPAQTVSVICQEDMAVVTAKMDLFGIGQYIQPADLTLGMCGATEMTDQDVIFRTQMHMCGSMTRMTEDSIIYTFTLNYVPRPMGQTPVVRTPSAFVYAECHLPRKHNVSSLALDPLWKPYSAVKVAEEFLYFTLKLMHEDWINERPIYQFYLGEMIRIEAVVKQYFHTPLRVYVDRCVATLAPDQTSTPNYAFIDQGCFVDAKVTGSDSKFMRRSAENKLQFELEAFRFHGADSGVLYITCHLKATSARYNIDEDHRACSYINNAWYDASGYDGACSTCDSIAPAGYGGGVGAGGAGGVGVGVGGGAVGGGAVGGGAGGKTTWNPGKVEQGRKMRSVSTPGVEWEGTVTFGPIQIGEKELVKGDS